jgi:hypothetical protein
MEFAGSELILPCQYHDLSGGYQLSGEQRLMLALLADAINVYQRGALSGLTRARRLYVDAERWITSDQSDRKMLSFSTVCEALGINGALLRRRIIQWKHTVSHRRATHQTARLQVKMVPRERHTGHRRGRPPELHASI